MSTQPKALELAAELDAVPETGADPDMVIQCAAELRRLHALNADLVEALHTLLSRDVRNTCRHEYTHRGGVIWEICNDCGAQWADDRGGKPEWKDPEEWRKAYAILAKAQEQQ